MKQIHTSIITTVGFAALAALTSANAATYSILNWELRNIVGQTGNGGVTGNYGTLTTTYISTTGDTDHLFQFSSTGNLDGFGTGNDTFTFILRVQGYTGSSVANVTTTSGDVTQGTPYDLFGTDGAPTTDNQHFGPGFDLRTGQSFRLNIESVSYTRGEDNESYVANFDGFGPTSGFGSADGRDYYVGETGAQRITATGNPVVVDPTSTASSILITKIASGATRFRDLDFSFTLTETLVPEPSSAMLIGLGAFGMILRRRRN